ncbi:tetratricopeptide repeat protein [Chamaesiphon minutus]|uniref:Tetratricopeptide repeat protein n=1 Tax=Chamaesiphon minutus (strain ATCC 27169 / PCC 6605) TaxID=1173020 RepID=K9UKY1_CHAP6|nr:tetratricopeptide repeat protein [Chamaesiphon minutus]AFY95490.1 tetratricopeptide repeat protein [Chamaesiphon minutus PCC 6605]
MDFSDNNLLIIYLAAFLSILSVAAFFVLRQILKTRKIESTLTRLEKKLKNERGTIPEYYELGSIYLEKRMFAQALIVFKKAIKLEDANVPEMAPVYNALGYAYFGQEQYDLAIRNYKEAIKLEPEYVMAMNNLGHAYEQKKLTSQALDVYEQALKLEPKNETAKYRSESLRRRLVTSN